MVYREILKQSFLLSLKYKWLWFFGLFATLLVGGGEYRTIFRNVEFIESGGVFIDSLTTLLKGESLPLIFENIRLAFNNISFWGILLTTLFILVAIAILLMSFISIGAIASGSFRVFKNQATSFKESFRRGTRKLWSVIGIAFAGYIAITLALVILSLPFYLLFLSSGALFWEWIIVLIAFIILIPAALIITFLVKYAIIFTVVKNSDLKFAIIESWQLFTKNWLVSLEFAAMMLLVDVFGIVLVLIGLGIIMLPFAGILFIAAQGNYGLLEALGLIIGGILSAIWLFISLSFLTTFKLVSWVNLFMKISEKGVISKIVRWAQGLGWA